MNTWLANITDALIDARLNDGDTVRFVVPTWSMYPLLAPGDRVSVRHARSDELRVGDVVVVKPSASVLWLTHRLIARRIENGSTHFITKGDNCAAPDPLWTESQMCGIVTAVWRAGARAPLDWQTRRARMMNRWLALVSRVQARAYAMPNGWWRRVLLKASRGLMRVSAFIARGVVG